MADESPSPEATIRDESIAGIARLGGGIAVRHRIVYQHAGFWGAIGCSCWAF